MSVGYTALLQQLSTVNLMVATADQLKDLVLILFSNAVVPGPSVVLADLTECVFPGYLRKPAWTGSAGYIDPGEQVRSTFPDSTFVAAAGISQIETATFAGTVTTAGDMTVTLTSAGLAGSPIALSVPVALADAGPELAAKAAAVIRSNAVISARFRVAVDGSDLVLTRGVPAANDATLNIAVADGTSVGVTAAPTSVSTQSGSATGGTVSDQVRGWALLNAAQDTLLYLGLLDEAVLLTAAGQGGQAEPEYVFGQ